MFSLLVSTVMAETSNETYQTRRYHKKQLVYVSICLCACSPAGEQRRLHGVTLKVKR